jgi:MerR family copper efflux transcriptional regulator
MQSLTIGQIAKRADFSVETVRLYEWQGLLADPDRKPSGYRQYDEEVVQRLRFIRRAKELATASSPTAARQELGRSSAAPPA